MSNRTGLTSWEGYCTLVTMRMILTRGLPASGKTTFAKKLVAEDPTFVRLNRDDFRQMLFGKAVLSAKGEQMVTAAQHGAIDNALKSGHNVIVDDTNFFERGVKALLNIARKYGAEVEWVDFTDIDLETLIARDEMRRNGAREKVAQFLSNHNFSEEEIQEALESFDIKSGSNFSSAVGEKVIRDMHARYIKGRPQPMPFVTLPEYELVPYEPDTNLPKAVIVDIDGTVAKMVDRSPYDWKRVGEDSPVQTVLDMVYALEKAGHVVLFTSGRDGSCEKETYDWLIDHYQGTRWFLEMREANDNRPDWIVKAEIFDKYYRDSYHVALVVDDRQQVVDMWRKLGLTVAQVAPGDF
jgi:predicted kinase